MNDLRDPSATATAHPAGTSARPAGTAAAAVAPDADPLHNLYRMSRTAGLGSGEYVAINNTSVVAFLMGLAGVLALLLPALLLLALAAVVLGVMALVQIRSSNGTQTGRGFAIAGILLALAFGGTTGGKIAMARAEQRSAEAKVAQAIGRLSEQLVGRQYDQAYDTLFSEKFKKDFTPEVFTTRWEGIDQNTGPLESVRYGGRTEFEAARGAAGRKAHARALFKLAKAPEESPLIIEFLEHDGEWVIESISEIFNGDQERQRRQQTNPGQARPLGPQMPPSPTR